MGARRQLAGDQAVSLYQTRAGVLVPGVFFPIAVFRRAPTVLCGHHARVCGDDSPAVAQT